MPKYAADLKKYPGSVFPPYYPCEFYDANGELVDREYIVCADTDTGEVTYIVSFDDGHGHAVYQVEKFLPPLVARPMRKREEADQPIIVEGK